MARDTFLVAACAELVALLLAVVLLLRTRWIYEQEFSQMVQVPASQPTIIRPTAM